MKGQTVLVTGGTGSLGHALVPLLLGEYDAAKVIVFSRSESKQAEMRQEFPDPRMRFFLGDVRDQERLKTAFHGVDVVIHAAALKRIEVAEADPLEVKKTNVDGTCNVNQAAIGCGVGKVMLISTDKACAPTTLYGASKLMAERETIAHNAYSPWGTKFSAVRYGNVIGSTGSVIPLFRKQRETGTLTITDPHMTRFWITLEQAARFVLDCVEDMHGGETFVPRMRAARVVDIAEAVAPGCKHKVVGIREGEKLHEELISYVEARRTTDPRYAKGNRFTIFPATSVLLVPACDLLPPGFAYTSDQTPLLSVEEIRDLIGEREVSRAVCQ